MNLDRRTWLQWAGASAVLAGAGGSRAAGWPDKPIRLVVGYATGGSTDAVSRVIGRQLEVRLGQPVIPEYKPGAGASVGADYVAKAAPDGYTLGLTDSGPMTILPALRKLPYDATKDFAPLSFVASTGLALIVHPDVPARTLGELMALLRSRPGQLDYASSGAGSVHHLAGELFKSQAQVFMTHIPYRGAAPALTDLLGGQVPVMFATIAPALPMIQAGRARALAVTSAARCKALPSVPTVAEQGLPGYAAELSFMMVGPTALPAAVSSRLQRELQAVLTMPAVVAQLEEIGMENVGPRTPERVRELVLAEQKKWGQLIRERKISLEG